MEAPAFPGPPTSPNFGLMGWIVPGSKPFKLWRLDVLLDRLAKEGIRVDPKRQDESYDRFAWIYDPDGNKIEPWQPIK